MTDRFDRAVKDSKPREIDGTFERIKMLFVVGLVIDAFLAVILVVLIFQAGSMSRSVRSVANTQSHLGIAQSATDQHTYENRAIVCVLQAETDKTKPPPPVCFDPHVLVFVPPQYSYTGTG